MSCTHMRPLTGGALIAVAMVVMVARQAVAETPPAAATDTGLEALAPATTVTPTAAQLIEPAELARLLSDTSSRRPEVLHVGFPILFRSGHITGSRHIGPASTPEGLQALKQALRGIPQRQSIVVLYCGCCPWVDCPNVRPALQLAQGLGRNDVKLLYLPRNLQRDWVEQGLPISSGDP
jgi:thiosulfate/3-mercaptopyruvate sulfurtransferase